MSNFYQDCAKDRSLLNQRLKTNPPPWTEAHTNVVQQIKVKVKTLPIPYVADENAFKIIESDASNIGRGGILKQKKEGAEQIVQFASGTWNPAEQNYSTIEKEVKAT